MAYTTRLHRLLSSADGIHQIHHWETSDLDSVDVDADDIGKVARLDVEGEYSFWLLVGTTPSEEEEVGEWREIGAGALLSDDDPENVIALGGEAGPIAGVSEAAARSDHRHVAEVGVPSSLGTANEEGTSVFLARSDHVHDGTTLAGDDDPTDVVAYREIVGEDDTTYLGESLPGVAPTYSRSDHQHAVLTAAPVAVAVGDANDEGESEYLARADHTHEAAAGVPVSIGTANGEGVADTFARSDHEHDGTGLLPLTIVTDSATAITLSVTHVRGYLRCTAATAAVVTVPLNFTDLPIGGSISGVQAGAGRVQIVGAGGVTINGSRTYTLEQWSPFSILKVAANAYDLSGDLVAY
jgi:hypothetical protein